MVCARPAVGLGASGTEPATVGANVPASCASATADSDRVPPRALKYTTMPLTVDMNPMAKPLSSGSIISICRLVSAGPPRFIKNILDV